MAARDRYSLALKCPKCGATGTVDLSEDDHPWVKKLNREVDAITPGFKTETLMPTYTARCEKCDVIAG